MSEQDHLIVTNINKIVLLIPYGSGMIDFFHHDCVMRVMGENQLILIPVQGASAIDTVRCVLANKALQITDAEILMWIDSDILFQPNQLMSMCVRLRESDYDVIGGLYAKRTPSGGIAGQPLVSPQSIVMFSTDDLIDAHHLGFGFTAVKRQLLLDMPLPECYFPNVGAGKFKGKPFFLPQIRDEVYQPEDVAFCQRVRDMGRKIGIHTKPRLQHRGMYDYGLEDASFKLTRYDELTVHFEPEKST